MSLFTLNIFVMLVTLFCLFGVVGEKKNESLRKCLAAIACTGILYFAVYVIALSIV